MWVVHKLKRPDDVAGRQPGQRVVRHCVHGGDDFQAHDHAHGFVPRHGLKQGHRDHDSKHRFFARKGRVEPSPVLVGELVGIVLRPTCGEHHALFGCLDTSLATSHRLLRFFKGRVSINKHVLVRNVLLFHSF